MRHLYDCLKKVATQVRETLDILQGLPFNCNVWRSSWLAQGGLVKYHGFHIDSESKYFICFTEAMKSGLVLFN